MIVVALGIMGIKLVSEAKQVQAHEQKALASLNVMSGSDVSKITEISSKLPQIQQETKQAEEIAHGFVWNVYSKLPWIGDDITTVQGMTTTVNSLASTSVPQFIDVIHDLQNTNIDAGSDVLNVQPILAVQPKLDNANSGLQKSVTTYNRLPGAHISIISNAYESGYTQLNSLANTVNQLTGTFDVLPTLLGAHGQQTYAIMAMTTSEMRSSGGLIGSVGQMTTDHGKITVGNFHSNGEYLQQNSGKASYTADEKRLFQDQGPLKMSLSVADSAVYPTTERMAQAMRDAWNNTSWGNGTPLDGVITVDPVFLQELIKINGNVTISNGTVLTGNNTAEYLLNTVYKDYPNENAMMDAVFADTATQAIDEMFKNANMDKLMATGQMLSSMAQERHFNMYSFNEEAEKTIQGAGFTATIPDSEEHPSVGIYLNEQNPSKMGWYADRSAVITPTSCKKAGKQTYHVEYMIKNTMTPEEAATLPKYITAANPKRGVGNLWEKMLFYAPAGGSIANFATSGTGTANLPEQVSLDGSKPYMTVVSVMPGQSLNISFDVTTSDKAETQLRIDQTPLGEPGYPVTVDTSTCKN